MSAVDINPDSILPYYFLNSKREINFVFTAKFLFCMSLTFCGLVIVSFLYRSFMREVQYFDSISYNYNLRDDVGMSHFHN
jgi:hypothetical protein